MAINSLQIAWISRLAAKGIIRRGDSMVEFGPQDLLGRRNIFEMYARRHTGAEAAAKVAKEIYDGETPRPITPVQFYSVFGVTRYRSLDLLDPRSDWMRDCNEHFTLPERFNIATNFGTAEHVFNIGTIFHSIHDALKPDGIALHILPAFGDINHGFFNIHPTVYLDLAAANNYTIEDLCYVDRWDIRNRTFEENPAADFDFDALPIRMAQLTDRPTLQRLVTEQFVANYNRADTQKYGQGFDSVLYDYCLVALRRNGDRAFRHAVQGIYGVSAPPPAVARNPGMLRAFSLVRGLKAGGKALIKRYVFPLIPLRYRDRLIAYVRSKL